MSDEPRDSRLEHLAPAVVAVAALATFACSIAFPFVGWDDPLHVLENPLVAHPLAQGPWALLRTARLGYPVPVVVLSYALNQALFGASAWSFHLVNVILHGANVLLVFHVARFMRLSSANAARAAALFGLHPLVAEPVCWVSGRKDLLATALLLGAIALLLVRSKPAALPSVRRLVAVTALVALAILAKPSAIVAPALVWIAARVARPLWRPRSLAIALAPMTALAAALAVVGTLGEVRVGAIASRGIADAALDVAGAWVLQLQHVVVPIDLVASYARLDGDPSRLAMAAGFVALLAVAAFAWRAPAGSTERAGLAFALTAYLPVSNVLALNRWVADSYMYLPLVGVSVTVGAIMQRRIAPRYARIAAFLGPFAACVLAVVSFAQSTTWRSSDSVWRPVVARYPTNPVAQTELARNLAWEGRDDDAIRELVRLDEKFPDFESALDERARARARTGDARRANELLRRGIDRGDLACAREFWIALLASSTPPSAMDRDAAQKAFVLAFPGMSANVLDAAVFVRLAEVLTRLHLDDEAARAQARALELARGAPSEK